MNHLGIMCPKNHIPYALPEEEEEFFEDQRIQAISLDVITGMFAGGKSRLSAFFRSFMVTDLPTERSYQRQAEPRQKITFPVICKTEPEKKLHDLVYSFLYPYLTGRITRETDPRDRLPMIEWLERQVKTMPELETLTQEIIEEVALDAFFIAAAKGLYVIKNDEVAQFESMASCDDLFGPTTAFQLSRVVADSDEFEQFLRALKEALPREFANREIVADVPLRERAIEALAQVNGQIKKWAF